MPAAPTRPQLLAALRRANAVARDAVAQGNHPFGAVLVDADGETVLLEQGNRGPLAHAESALLQRAFEQIPADRLWHCTLVTTVEPCAMCAGTQYWANVGRVVYGMSEHRLRAFTGAHAENPTLDLPCRRVFETGQKAIEVTGPVPEIEDEIAALHRDFWRSR
jgi:tRNA(Arg) A34 adenosine deaminase TadA